MIPRKKSDVQLTGRFFFLVKTFDQMGVRLMRLLGVVERYIVLEWE